MPAHPELRTKPTLLERLLARWPGQCAVCRSWSGTHVCAPCRVRYAAPAPRCWTCALRLPTALADRPRAACGACLRHPPPLDRCVAALDYGFPWDGLVQRYKFQQAIELRATLNEALQLALDAGQIEAPDWLLPVPLSAARLKQRGYNQSYELSRGLARQRGLRCDARLLLRVRDNPRQSDLPLAERRSNVRGVFALDPLRAGEIRGRRVALLDDVMTSGATLFELAEVLRRAGATHVQAWVVARTPAPN